MAQRFKGKVLNGATKYVAIPMERGGRLFIDVQWKDATSAATITFEDTGSDNDAAPVDVAGPAWVWKTEAGVVVAGPPGGAAGSTKVHTTSLACRRARLKIVATADCDFEIYSDCEGI